MYIALPNHMHRDYAVAAARAGKHVLCEKPLAVTPAECEEMIEAAADAGVRLMTAYRLHFERANLKAVEIVRSGKLGEPRIFESVFTMQVEEGNVRLAPTDRGGGPIYDIGIYCINAARYLFRAEPSEVLATSASIGGKRFARTPEMMSCDPPLPGREAGHLHLQLRRGRRQLVSGRRNDAAICAWSPPTSMPSRSCSASRSTAGRARRRSPNATSSLPSSSTSPTASCRGREPEPSGAGRPGGLRIIRALLESAWTGRVVKLDEFERHRRPTMALEKKRPPVPRPKLVHVASPSGN